jgi:hypothetical protein
MRQVSVRLNADATPLLAALDELRSLLERLPAPLELDGDRLSPELCQLLVDGALDPAKLVGIDSNPATDGTRDMLVAFQPSELFLQLLAALRTRNVDDV